MDPEKLGEIIEKLPRVWQDAIKKAIELLDKRNNYAEYDRERIRKWKV